MKDTTMTEQEIRALIFDIERKTEILEAQTALQQKELVQALRRLKALADKFEALAHSM